MAHSTKGFVMAAKGFVMGLSSLFHVCLSVVR